MTINYTTLLGLAQPVTGTEANTWGTVVNDEITALIEEAIAGGESIDVTAGNVTLTDTDGVPNQARNAILIVSGTPGTTRNIIAPSQSKWYVVINGSDGAVVVKGSATTGVTIAAGARSVVAWNGSDFVEVAAAGDVDGPASSTDNAIARFDGTSGKIIQNSAVTIADTTGDISTPGYVITGAGAVGTPAYTTTGDTNTGIFFPAADTIAFTEGGVEAMRIDSSGRVGIGTSSPDVSLAVSGQAKFGALSNPIRVNSSSTTSILEFPSTTNGAAITQLGSTSPIRFLTDGNERMRIDSSGNVGIGTSSPAFRLEAMVTSVSGVPSAFSVTNFTNYASERGVSIAFRSGLEAPLASVFTSALIGSVTTGGSGTGNGNLVFYTAANQVNTERMRITSAGGVNIGGTTTINDAVGSLQLSGSGSGSTSGGGILNFFRPATDGVINGSNLGSILFFGADTTGNTPTQLAFIRGQASGTHSAGDNPTDIVFGCTNDGSETVAEFARLSQSGASGRHFTVTQPTIGNSSEIIVGTLGGASGSSDRRAAIGTTKHSGITNACGFIWIDPEDGTDNFMWVDNSDILRISTTYANIGTTGGTVVGTQTSDERLKDISGPVTYGLTEVLAIEPIAFTMKDDPNIAKIGFSAQQVQPIVPEAVYDTKECIDGYTENEETKEQIPNSDRTKLAMEYTQLIPVLVNAVKELSAKNDALEVRIAALEAK